MPMHENEGLHKKTTMQETHVAFAVAESVHRRDKQKWLEKEVQAMKTWGKCKKETHVKLETGTWSWLIFSTTPIT